MSLKSKALEGSIKKWENIAYHGGVDHGTKNCSLCELYDEDHCKDCPVHQFSGDHCNNTPYEEWAEHHRLAHSVFHGQVVECDECKRLAIAELEFLKSLRDK